MKTVRGELPKVGGRASTADQRQIFRTAKWPRKDASSTVLMVFFRCVDVCVDVPFVSSMANTSGTEINSVEVISNVGD
jgi:hypothetical protein